MASEPLSEVIARIELERADQMWHSTADVQRLVSALRECVPLLRQGANAMDEVMSGPSKRARALADSIDPKGGAK